MKKTVGKWLILILLLSYTAIVGSWAVTQAESRKCSGIDIVINSQTPADFVTREGVMNRLDSLAIRYPLLRLADINTDSLERVLSKVNNFESVECVKMTDGKLQLQIVPMIPEIRVFSDSSSFYINKDGKRIDAYADYFLDVPIVSGKFNERISPADLLTVTRQIARDSLMKNLVTMIVVKSPTDIILVPRIKGHVINIGDTSRLKEKFDNLSIMYKQVIPYKGWNTYDTISVKFKNQIVATRRDKRAKFKQVEIVDEIDYEELALSAQTMVVTGSETEADVEKANRELEKNNPQKQNTNQ